MHALTRMPARHPAKNFTWTTLNHQSFTQSSPGCLHAIRLQQGRLSALCMPRGPSVPPSRTRRRACCPAPRSLSALPLKWRADDCCPSNYCTAIPRLSNGSHALPPACTGCRSWDRPKKGTAQQRPIKICQLGRRYSVCQGSLEAIDILVHLSGRLTRAHLTHAGL